MNATFTLVTLGCKVNHYESETLAGCLAHAGWRQVFPGDGIPADVCIINTCTVTQKASMQSRQAVRQSIRRYPDAEIIVTGCYAQTEKDQIAAIEGVDYIVGHSDKHRIPEIVRQGGYRPNDPPVVIVGDIFADMTFRSLPMGDKLSRARPFLKIQDGCNAFCTYCIVPYARGKSRSMPLDEVIDNIRRIKRLGRREVVLTGIHLGRYGRDLVPSKRLYDLLSAIDQEALIDRVRLSSLEPNEITNDFLQLVHHTPRICRHFHIPLQSGDDTILQRMHRPYTRKQFRELIWNIHERFPEAAIGLDILIGFPGETEQSYQNTYSLVDELPISYLHVFPFSSRPGTPAHRYPNKVPDPLIKKRARNLRLLAQKKKMAFYRKFQGRNLQIVVEGKKDPETGLFKGFSDNYVSVSVTGNDDMINALVDVSIQRVGKNGCFGKTVGRPR